VPALDGLRAVAVLAVLGVHAWQAAFPGGWVGVDVFFVLSGYLITSILLSERDRIGRISLRGFYLRRALRLLPALAVCMLVALGLAQLQGPGLLRVTEQEAAATALYVANWWQVLTPHAPLGLLPHTWSLSIEEQFYLCWPVLMCVLLSLGGRRAVLWGALAAGVLVLLYRLVVAATLALPYLTYYRTDTRVDSLLIGAALAALAAEGLLARIPARALRLAAMLGMVILATVFLHYGIADLDRIGYSVIALAAASVLAAVVAPHGWTGLRRALSWRPLLFVGRISYGFYLYHFVILRGLVTRLVPVGPLALLLTAVITLGVAAASHRYVEHPFLRMKDLLGDRGPAPVAAEPVAA
jgi:peptidoglycan/LPS O-acetylase OafA/YrhL